MSGSFIKPIHKKLIIKPNATDTEVWELVDKSQRCDVLVGPLLANVFNGTRLGNAIDHGIEQDGYYKLYDREDTIVKMAKIKKAAQAVLAEIPTDFPTYNAVESFPVSIEVIRALAEALDNKALLEALNK